MDLSVDGVILVLAGALGLLVLSTFVRYGVIAWRRLRPRPDAPGDQPQRQ